MNHPEKLIWAAVFVRHFGGEGGTLNACTPQDLATAVENCAEAVYKVREALMVVGDSSWGVREDSVRLANDFAADTPVTVHLDDPANQEPPDMVVELLPDGQCRVSDRCGWLFCPVDSDEWHVCENAKGHSELASGAGHFGRLARPAEVVAAEGLIYEPREHSRRTVTALEGIAAAKAKDAHLELAQGVDTDMETAFGIKSTLAERFGAKTPIRLAEPPTEPVGRSADPATWVDIAGPAINLLELTGRAKMDRGEKLASLAGLFAAAWEAGQKAAQKAAQTSFSWPRVQSESELRIALANIVNCADADLAVRWEHTTRIAKTALETIDPSSTWAGPTGTHHCHLEDGKCVIEGCPHMPPPGLVEKALDGSVAYHHKHVLFTDAIALDGHYCPTCQGPATSVSDVGSPVYMCAEQHSWAPSVLPTAPLCDDCHLQVGGVDGTRLLDGPLCDC